MDEKLQSKVCFLLMAMNGALLAMSPRFAAMFAQELTSEEQAIIIELGKKYDIKLEKEVDDGNVHVEW